MLLLFGLLVTLALSGCSTTETRNQELHRVAKDWSSVIRASQVIPVYPLTEDLQPGDIFLVQLTVDRQHELYDQEGFLPLDNMIRRVNPRGYKDYYQQSFGVGGSENLLPKHWLRADKDTKAWSLAPNATFPTYSFSIRSGGGFNLAFPIQGVPIGLSLLDTDSAEGTVTIADARTYGVDVASLYKDVRKWADHNRDFVKNYAPIETCKTDTRARQDCQNYLRVISRIYLAGSLNVSLQSNRTSGAQASGGASKPVDLLAASPGKDPHSITLESYAGNISKLNTMIEDSMLQKQPGGTAHFLPGGTVKIAAASARAISLIETFNRPLVIGYLGFDMAIGREGILGPPIPTLAVLQGELKPRQTTSSIDITSLAALRMSYELLKEAKNDTHAGGLVQNLDKLANLVPENYPVNIYGFRDVEQSLAIIHPRGSPVQRGEGGFPLLISYKGELLKSFEKLEQASDGNPETLQTEQKLEELDQTFKDHESLLREAQEYANKISRQ